MIENFITQAKRALPLYWPLESFIATNPLWDLHEEPLESSLIKIKTFTPIEGAMPQNFYQTLYNEDKISEAHITEAITEYLCKNKEKNDDFNKESFQQIRNSLFEANDSIEKKPKHLNQTPLLISEFIELEFNKEITSTLRKEILQFLLFYFNQEQSETIIEKENDLYESWVKSIASQCKKLQSTTKNLPTSKFFAIEQIFIDFKISPENQTDYLTKIYFQILGWASLIKWLELRPDNPFTQLRASLVDIALIWLCYEKSYFQDYKNKSFSLPACNTNNLNDASSSQIKTRLIWQRAYELSYQSQLLEKLQNHEDPKKINPSNKISTQAIFCIDTRSEGIRRHLETISGYETYGFAGFFGFFFEYKETDESCHQLQCPGLFPPEINLHSEAKVDWLNKQFNHFSNSLKKPKKSLLSAFTLVELTGLWYALAMIFKSILLTNFKPLEKFLPHNRHKKIMKTLISTAQTNNAFSLTSKVNNSVQFLKTIGLTKEFAPLILICGHGGETENNPYQASFDCGACGGNAGYVNAIVACHILNDKSVRKSIALLNITIPESTLFIAGFHNTTRDKIELYEQEIPSSHHDLVLKLKKDLHIASQSLKQERIKDLPGDFSVNNRSCHWAELIPEMGLIKNAALIIGPRSLTQDISLDRRVFLHSYDPAQDPDGALLKGILLGPLIVAHWINAQYYFSTTDPNLYGSGNKMLHNVIPTFGVMEGNFSDLKIGLPWQSIAFRDKILHEPLRLLVIIYAPALLVNSLLLQHPSINALFTGGWAHLKIIEPRK